MNDKIEVVSIKQPSEVYVQITKAVKEFFDSITLPNGEIDKAKLYD
jgi:hypothetical protein